MIGALVRITAAYILTTELAKAHFYRWVTCGAARPRHPYGPTPRALLFR